MYISLRVNKVSIIINYYYTMLLLLVDVSHTQRPLLQVDHIYSLLSF